MAELNDDYLLDPVDPSQQDNNYYEPDYPNFDPSNDNYYDEPNNEPEPKSEPEPQTEDYLSRMLKIKGIDRNRVRIENEDGEIEEWKFDDLDDETKFGILSETESPITDEEMEYINYLRKNQMNLQDFAEYQKNQAIEEYLKQNQTQKYTVDKLSDDDLYRFDLKDQMPDLTDEEVEDQLSRAKENETFFNKKIAALRKEYTELENQQIAEIQAQADAEREEQFNQLAYSLVNAARATEEMNGMTLDDEDKEEILSFMLDRDANGQSQFYKLFENPQKLFEMAWFALKGKEAYEALTEYYKGEITKARRAANPNPNTAPRTVRRPQNKSNEVDPYGLDSVFKRK